MSSSFANRTLRSSASSGVVQTPSAVRKPGAAPMRSRSNQTMARELSTGVLQRKLTVNQPGDKFEQEADRVADAVMRMPDPAISAQPVSRTSPTGVQRCSCGQSISGTEPCQDCKDKTMALQRASSGSSSRDTAPPIVHEVLGSRGQPLDHATRDFMEPRFGADFSGVRVHADPKAAESARAVDALAYTVGHDIVLGQEQYAPQTTAGRRLLTHELTHVMQQASGSAMVQRACLAGVPKTPGCVPDPSITPPTTRFLFRDNCDDFEVPSSAPFVSEEARMEAFFKAISPTAKVRIVGLASFEGPVHLNQRLACSRARRGQAVVKRSAPAGVTITSVDATVGGPKTAHDATMRAVGVEVSTPPPPPKETITSETVFTSPGARTRTTIGVGEKVSLTHSPGTAAWTTTGGTLSAANGAKVILTAPDTASKITVTAGKATIAFDVITPNDVHMDRFGTTGVKHTVNHADSGIETLAFLLPDTVNFGGVTYHELNVGATVSSPGAYSCFTGFGHCRKTAGGVCADLALTNTVVAGKGTQAVIRDCVYSGDCLQTAPFTPGNITFSIPYEYKVGGGAFHPISTVAQVSTLAADKITLSSSKAGATGQTTVAANTLTNPASGGLQCP